MSKWTTANIPDQTGRTAVITGANTGLGYETAAALAAKGASVVLAVRNLDKGKEAARRIEQAQQADSKPPSKAMPFDREVAPLYGIPDRWMDTLLSLILAATVIASMQILGVTMIAAIIVVPAVTARLLTDSFARMVFLSTAIGTGCGLVGLLLSYYLDVASGATVVLTAATILSSLERIAFIP